MIGRDMSAHPHELPRNDRRPVEGPHRILADSYEPGPTLALDIVDDEGDHTIVTLHKSGS